MKKLLFLIVILGLIILSVPDASLAVTSAKQREQTWCEEWCQSHKDNCDFCSKNRNCGPGYFQQASFGSLDRAWFACVGGVDDKANQKACEDWCEQNKGAPKYCARCTPLTGCGQGYKVLTIFKGKGKNWHACAKTDFKEASDKNKADCEKWCEEHKAEGCVSCDTIYGCTHGYEPMKHFTGKGTNWHACKRRGSFKEASESNEAECKQWCEANKDKGCVKCDTKYGCGAGYEPTKHFTGHGKNWHACKVKYTGVLDPK